MKLKKIHKQDGFILALTLLCALILSSVMVSTMFVSTKGQKITKNFKESVQTLNAADAAVKQAKQSLASWLTTTQMASGTESNFSSVLTSSGLTGTNGSSGTLVIPSNSTNWGNMNLFGNTVTVTVFNTESGASSGSTDSDRIIVLQAEATSATRQRVRIKATVQAPSTGNTAGGMPTIPSSAVMCSDATGKRQKLTVKQDTILSGHNHALPSVFPGNANTWNSSSNPGGYKSSEDVLTVNSVPAGWMVNALKQSVNISHSGDVYGAIGGVAKYDDDAVYTASSSTTCSDMYNFADQVSLLSDSLPNVDVITTTTLGSANLGTRTSPKIVIVDGTTTVNKKKVTKNKVKIDSGSSGAGILILQGETETADSVLVTGKNFYYEGLIIVYGDDKAVLRMKKEEAVYGAGVVITGSEDDGSVERMIFNKDGRFAYSTEALAKASAAFGSATGSSITSTSDARNTVLTVGWYEDYNF